MVQTVTRKLDKSLFSSLDLEQLFSLPFQSSLRQQDSLLASDRLPRTYINAAPVSCVGRRILSHLFFCLHMFDRVSYRELEMAQERERDVDPIFQAHELQPHKMHPQGHLQGSRVCQPPVSIQNIRNMYAF